MLLMGLAILTLCGCSNENGKVEKSASDVVIETIMTRRSIRQYKDEPVSREQMETILKCGINAPSGNNRQEWEIRVVDNPEFINGCTEAWKKTLDADRLTKMVLQEYVPQRSYGGVHRLSKGHRTELRIPWPEYDAFGLVNGYRHLLPGWSRAVLPHRGWHRIFEEAGIQRGIRDPLCHRLRLSRRDT